MVVLPSAIEQSAILDVSRVKNKTDVTRALHVVTFRCLLFGDGLFFFSFLFPAISR